MNPDTNRFEALRVELESKIDQCSGLFRPDGSKVPAHWTTFTLDERVVIKNYTFRVAYIGETAILFEPVGPVIVDGGQP